MVLHGYAHLASVLGDGTVAAVDDLLQSFDDALAEAQERLVTGHAGVMSYLDTAAPGVSHVDLLSN